MSYQSQWVSRRDEVLAIALKVQIEHPDAWNELKIHGQTSRRFINLVSMACMAKGIPAGVNLKRGGPQQSIDALAFPNATGAPDSTGTYPGVEIIDIVGGAEGPTPSLTWGDVTQITIDTGNKGGWKAGSLSVTPGPVPQPAPVLKSRDRFFAELTEINAFYASADGLQRPGGMVIDRGGVPTADVEALGAWGYSLMLGATVDECKADIRRSDEWKGKHR